MNYSDTEASEMALSVFKNFGEQGGRVFIADQIASVMKDGDLQEVVKWLGVSQRFEGLARGKNK